MRDVGLIKKAGSQHNRVSRAELVELGFSPRAIEVGLLSRRLVRVEQGVFALPPVLDDPWGRWMGATLTALETYLSHLSAARAWGFWGMSENLVEVTRVGSGGPRTCGRIRVHRSTRLAGDTVMLNAVPLTKPARTLVDIAPAITERGLARCVREAVRLERTSIAGIAEALGRHRGRRGAGMLGEVIARYSDLPIQRARSGAEVRALELLRAAGRPMPALNVKVAGLEADLSWPEQRRIVEIDGVEFHLDRGEDQRRDALWSAAGWHVSRIPASDIYAGGELLLAAAPIVR